MSPSVELDLKQRLSALSERDRRAISSYLIRLKRQSLAGRKEASRIMREMDAGQKTPLCEVAAKLGHV